MKESFLASTSIRVAGNSHQHAKSLLLGIESAVRSSGKVLNRIGTAIALGEAGNLDAAHALRSCEHRGQK